MAFFSNAFTRNPPASGRADVDMSLDPLVRQILRLSGSKYERDKAESCGLLWAYYKGIQYSTDFLQLDVNGAAQSMELGAQLQARKQLWKGIKPILSVPSIACDVDRRLCYKKARPVPVSKDAALEARLTAKWEQDRWRRRTPLSALYGSVMGTSYKRVIPGSLEGNPGSKSRLAVYSPEVMTLLRDQHNHHHITAAKIEYRFEESTEGPDPRKDILGTLMNYQNIQESLVNQSLGITPGTSLHTYTMVITEDAYYTFRDHILYAYDDNLGNSWANTLGVVPVVEVPFNDIGEDMGLPTFYSVLPQIDAINELMSMAGTILKNMADPLVIVTDAPPGFTITKSLEEGSSGNVVYVRSRMNFTGQPQPQPKIEYLELKGSGLSGLLEWVNQTKEDVQSAVPEMQMRASQLLTGGSGHARELNMQDLIDKVSDMRETHFDADEDAMQMALVSDDLDASGEKLSPDQVAERIEAAGKDYDLEIWADTVLERDRVTESSIISTNLADGLMSKYTARLTYGMTYTQAEQEAIYVEKEFQDELARQRAWLQLQKDFGIVPPAMLPTAQDVAMMGGNALSISGPTQRNGSADNRSNATRPTQRGAGPQGANQAVKSQPNTRSGNPHAGD